MHIPQNVPCLEPRYKPSLFNVLTNWPKCGSKILVKSFLPTLILTYQELYKNLNFKYTKYRAIDAFKRIFNITWSSQLRNEWSHEHTYDIANQGTVYQSRYFRRKWEHHVRGLVPSVWYTTQPTPAVYLVTPRALSAPPLTGVPAVLKGYTCCTVIGFNCILILYHFIVIRAIIFVRSV